MKRNTGFTLIELVIVICIMLVLAGISVPSFVAWSRNSRFKEAAQTALMTLRQAKGQAININQKVTVRFTLDTSAANDNNRVAIGTGDPAFYAPAILLNKGIEIKGGTDCDNEIDPVSIVFNPSGSAGTGYVCIFDGATRKYKVGVSNSNTARILFFKWQDGVWK